MDNTSNHLQDSMISKNVEDTFNFTSADLFEDYLLIPIFQRALELTLKSSLCEYPSSSIYLYSEQSSIITSSNSKIKIIPSDYITSKDDIVVIIGGTQNISLNKNLDNATKVFIQLTLDDECHSRIKSFFTSIFPFENFELKTQKALDLASISIGNMDDFEKLASSLIITSTEPETYSFFKEIMNKYLKEGLCLSLDSGLISIYSENQNILKKIKFNLNSEFNREHLTFLLEQQVNLINIKSKKPSSNLMTRYYYRQKIIKNNHELIELLSSKSFQLSYLLTKRLGGVKSLAQIGKYVLSILKNIRSQKINSIYKKSSKDHKKFNEIAYEILQTGTIRRGSKICFFAHFHRNGVVFEYVIKHIKELKKAGYNIVFCTTSPNFPEDEKIKIQDLCSFIIKRENIGLDFGSWHTSMKVLEKETLSAQSIILTNDSIIGPFSSIQEIILNLEQNNAYKGLLSSNEVHHHHQSFYLCISKNLINSNNLGHFISSFKYYKDKIRIIKEYEIGFQNKIKSRPSKALIESDAVIKIEPYRIRPTGLDTANTTLLYWDILLSDFNFPFLKKELIKNYFENNFQTDLNDKCFSADFNLLELTLNQKNKVHDFTDLDEVINDFSKV